MNEVEEQRVVEALRALTGRLTVSERDTIDAGIRMQNNLKAPAPRRNRALLAVAAAVVLIVGVATFQAINGDEKSAPSPAAPPSPADTLEAAMQAIPYTATFTDAEFTAGTPPTAQDLSGLWLIRAPYQDSLVINGNLDWSYHSVQKQYVGSSTLDGQTWTRDPAGPCPIRGAGRLDPLPWTASIAEDGSLHLLFAGETNVCTPAGDREVWDRLVPGPSPVMDYLRETSGEVDWAAPTDPVVQGLFVNMETGHVLEVARSGNYTYLDTVTGQAFTPSDEGTLDLSTTTGTIAGTCNGGSFSATFEVGQTEAVPDYITAQNLVRIGAGGEACSQGLGAGGVWLKVA